MRRLSAKRLPRKPRPEISRKPKKAEESAKKSSKKQGGTAKYVVISSACTALVFLVIVGVLVGTVFRESVFGNKASSEQSSDVWASAPSVDEIGTIDSGAEVSAVLFTVPQLTGKYYAWLFENLYFSVSLPLSKSRVSPAW